jgi:hypothetical protein
MPEQLFDIKQVTSYNAVNWAKEVKDVVEEFEAKGLKVTINVGEVIASAGNFHYNATVVGIHATSNIKVTFPVLKANQ